MRKLFVLLISVLLAMVLISGGYGVWTEQIEIEGNLQVIPDPEVISSMKTEISSLMSTLDSLERQLEGSENERAYEEQQKILAEQQAALEALKLLGQQEQGEQKNVSENADRDVDLETHRDKLETIAEDTTSEEDNSEEGVDNDYHYEEKATEPEVSGNNLIIVDENNFNE